MDFGEYIVTEKKKADKALELLFEEQITKAKQVDEELVDLMNRIKKIVFRGGKRVRSLLARIAFELAEGNDELDVMKASLFLELTHLYILVHDDIADGDLKRYGGPTLEVVFRKLLREKMKKDSKRFGYSTAMVCGDLLSTLAHEVLHQTNFPAERKSHVELLMADTFKQVATGWYLHQVQNHESLETASEKRYLDGMKLVSASYSFESPLMMGLALAGNMDLEKPLAEYAEHVGMAFQIKDDLLGVFGQTQLTGKPVGNDVREGKKTLLILRAYKQADKFGRKFLDETVGRDLSEEELDEVQNIIRETGAYDDSVDLAREHSEKAKEVLKTLPVANKELVKRLEELADFVVNRNH